jgi:hypothetical protein
MKGGFFKNLMSSKSDRMDEAKELYSQAANCYKMADGMEDRAIEMLNKCADCEEQEQDKANFYKDCAILCKDRDSVKYIEYSKKAIDGFFVGNRVSTAATHAKEVAMHLESEFDYDQSIFFWQKAQKFYELESMSTYSN